MPMLQTAGKKRLPLRTGIQVLLKKHLQDNLADSASSGHRYYFAVRFRSGMNGVEKTGEDWSCPAFVRTCVASNENQHCQLLTCSALVFALRPRFHARRPFRALSRSKFKFFVSGRALPRPRQRLPHPCCRISPQPAEPPGKAYHKSATQNQAAVDAAARSARGSYLQTG